MATNNPGSTRPGRLPAADRPAREAAVLDAAIDELVEHGYERVTMLGVARRAGASKETLYAWFGDKQGLFTALIRRQADATMDRVTAALTRGDTTAETLEAFAFGLLSLLLDEPSISLNRAAMASPELASVLLAEGRHRVGPAVERFLADRAEAGELAIDDAATAFTLLYGLVIEDAQIRALLGEPPLSERQRRVRAREAVARFTALTGA